MHVGGGRSTGHQERFYESTTRRECLLCNFKHSFPRLREIGKQDILHGGRNKRKASFVQGAVISSACQEGIPGERQCQGNLATQEPDHRRPYELAVTHIFTRAD